MKEITEDQNFLSPYIFRKIKRPDRNMPWSKSFWMNINGDNYMFKCDENIENNTQKLYSELIVSKLCEKLDIPCVKYAYAVKKGILDNANGVIVKSFLKGDEKEISFKDMRYGEELKKIKDLVLPIEIMYAKYSPVCTLKKWYLLDEKIRQLLDEQDPKQKWLLKIEKDFLNRHRKELEKFYEKAQWEKKVTIKTHLERVKKHCDKYGYKIEGNMKLQLQKIAIVDFVTRQTDRQGENLSLILNPQTKTVKLAPMFDNGNTFGFSEKDKPGEYPDCSNQYIELTESDYKEIADKTTEIGAFYEKVKNFKDNGLNEFLEGLKIEAKISRDSNKECFKDKALSLSGCEKYIDDVKDYYQQGIDYIEGNINKFSPKQKNLVV